jgi:hypothetical protein
MAVWLGDWISDRKARDVRKEFEERHADYYFGLVGQRPAQPRRAHACEGRPRNIQDDHDPGLPIQALVRPYVLGDPQTQLAGHDGWDG